MISLNFFVKDILCNLGIGINAKITSIERFKNQLLALNIFNGWNIEVTTKPFYNYKEETKNGTLRVVFEQGSYRVCFDYTIENGRVIGMV